MVKASLLATCLLGALAAACGRLASSPGDEDAGPADAGATDARGGAIAVDAGADPVAADAGTDAGPPATQGGDIAYDAAGVDAAPDFPSSCGATVLEVSCTRKDTSSDLLVRIWKCGALLDAEITQSKPRLVAMRIGNIDKFDSMHFITYSKSYYGESDAAAAADGYPWYIHLQTYEPTRGAPSTVPTTGFRVAAIAADGGSDVLVADDDMVCAYTGN